MVESVKSGLWYLTDKMGDATIRVLDEMKFWGEVLVEFMEYDQSSSDRYFQEYKNEIKEQLEDTQEYQKEVDQLIAAQEEQKLEEELKEDTLNETSAGLTTSVDDKL